MLVRSLPSTVSPVTFDRPVTLPLAALLAARLDALLTVMPIVVGVGIDPVLDACAAPLGLDRAGLVLRHLHLDDGQRVTVAAVPGAVGTRPDVRSSAYALKRAAGMMGRRVILAPEGALAREPRLTNALLVAGCAATLVSPSDRLALMTALVEEGGSMPLADAAEIMVRADDPVAAVLALVAGRAVALDLTLPLGPESRVTSLAARGRTAQVRR